MTASFSGDIHGHSNFLDYLQSNRMRIRPARTEGLTILAAYKL